MSENDEKKRDQEAEAAPVCEFDAELVTTGENYSVAVNDKDIKDGKVYLVEVQIGQETREVDGEVVAQGTMVLDVAPWSEGSGIITVFEYDARKNKRKEKAQCTFVVEPPPCVSDSCADLDDDVTTVCGTLDDG